MEIINISEINSRKYLVEYKRGFFTLSKADLERYGVVVGDLDGEIANDIFENLLPQRALEKSLKIITGRDMTEGMIRHKLEEDYYPEEAIDSAIDRLKNERLIDDERYIRGFIEAKSSKKSRRDIMSALSQKKADMNLAEKIYEELSSNSDIFDEKELIVKLLLKRHYDFENADYEEKQKQIRYLLGKGFSMDSIHSALKGL